jgi:hypothetical protein
VLQAHGIHRGIREQLVSGGPRGILEERTEEQAQGRSARGLVPVDSCEYPDADRVMVRLRPREADALNPVPAPVMLEHAG